MSWSAAIATVAETIRKVFDWKTGGRTKDENVLRDDADHWKEEYDKAMAAGDFQTGTDAMSQLRRVRDAARAQRGT
ncbi:MAG: hypothetical protein ACYCZR_00945 [Burkholderiales bacterium]